MERSGTPCPTHEFIVRRSGDETLVYDTRSDTVTCLPADLAVGWESCETALDRRRFLTRALTVSAGSVAAMTLMAPTALAAGQSANVAAMTSNLVTLYTTPTDTAYNSFGQWALYSGGDPLGRTPLAAATTPVADPPVKYSATMTHSSRTRIQQNQLSPTQLAFTPDPTVAGATYVTAVFTLPNPSNAATLSLSFLATQGSTVLYGDPTGPLTQVTGDSATHTMSTTYTAASTTSLVVAVTTSNYESVQFTTLQIVN